ncbi:hypothetical protein PpBr36_02307, partial [Pyricularia pennisetigena]|uniref:hypothetical protein n=1 Tax=Pyricularia pennisetigena TaxID=1578925 RepID=UPI00114F8215
VWVISWWNEERGDTEGGKNTGLGFVEGDRVGLFVILTVKLKIIIAIYNGSCSMAVSSFKQAILGVSTIFNLVLCENFSGGDNKGSELRNFVIARGDNGSSLCEINDKYGTVAGIAGLKITQGDSANREHYWQNVEDGDNNKKAIDDRDGEISIKLFNDCLEISLTVRPGAAKNAFDAGNGINGIRVNLLSSVGEVWVKYWRSDDGDSVVKSMVSGIVGRDDNDGGPWPDGVGATLWSRAILRWV